VTPAAPVAIPIVPAVPVSQRDDYDGDEWYTPAEYIAAAKQVMGLIDLDPASSDLAQTVVRAEGYLSKEDDGLAYPWRAETIWLNPPYSNPAPWVEKLISEFQTGSRQIKHALVLVNNSTETAWFQSLLQRYPVCFPAKRIAFWRHDQSGLTARQGQAVFYLGPDIKQFVAVFGQFGPVLGRWM
jgi:phage N-6-adenine-methyltransferase